MTFSRIAFALVGLFFVGSSASPQNCKLYCGNVLCHVVAQTSLFCHVQLDGIKYCPKPDGILWSTDPYDGKCNTSLGEITLTQYEKWVYTCTNGGWPTECEQWTDATGASSTSEQFKCSGAKVTK